MVDLEENGCAFIKLDWLHYRLMFLKNKKFKEQEHKRLQFSLDVSATVCRHSIFLQYVHLLDKKLC